ncbi:YkvA family protein [Barnesiella propionica]|uniref:YkvA family protein n=1 Tax=Barnesiella propionica TaxID=2981781 RepID=UPI0011C72158|nr:YkvA family protein [Barnesiella propionica]MCU6769794.1 YkvA family protein [Barnesiella propionica]
MKAMGILSLAAVEKYGKYFSDSGFWKKLKKVARKAGSKVIYVSLLLYYMMTGGTVSLKDKVLIMGALGYFIFPLDLIPDFLLPPLGYSDDLSVLLFVYSKIKAGITPEIKARADDKLKKLLGDTKTSSL